MKAPKKTLLATSLLALPALASALGLGGITVRSGLNQPLDAEISVSVNSPAERDTLSVQLATAEDWSRVGIDSSRTPSDLKFVIEKNARGEPVIRVTSEQIIREPYLQMLIEVNWAKGRLLREYSVLLDPPVMASALGSSATSSPAKETISAPAMAETMPASKPVVEAKPVVVAKPAVDAQPSPAPRMSEVPAAAPASKAAADSYGPTKGGDTLWLIANANRPSSNTSLDRMMVAILRMNPDAFQNGNINSLKKGQILRLPSASETDKISLPEAKRVISEQNTLWRGYQTRSAESAIQVADPGASAALRPSAIQAESQPRLELLPPKTNTGDSQALSTARADLARLKEDINSKQAEATDLKARVGQLETLQGDQKRMIELKDSEIASLNKSLAEMRLKATAAAESAVVAAAEAAVVATVKTPVETAVKAPEASPPPPISTENVDPVAAITEPKEDTKEDIWGAEPSANDPATTAASDPALAAAIDPSTGMPDTAPPMDGTTVTPVADEPAVVSEPVAEPVDVAPVADAVVEEKPWYMNPFVLGGAGLGIAGLLGFALTRKKAPAPIKPTGMSLSDNFGIPSIGVEPAIGGFADNLGDEDEARIQAAINANPQDLWAHLDLLRLYFSRRDSEKFESAASSMFGFVVDTESAQWAEARAMGEQLVPQSALFQALPDFGSMDSTGDMAFDTSGFEPTVVQAPIPPPSYQAAKEDEPLGALDLAYFDEPAMSSNKTSAPVVPAEDAAFNFDLDLDAPVPSPLAAEVVPPVAEEKNDFNFDFNFDTPSKLDVAPQLPPATGLGDINIDDVMPVALDSDTLDISADDLMIGEDSVGTKLDLARAYLDMGDPDGARSMLEEVLSEGSDLQRNEAKDLLGRMA